MTVSVAPVIPSCIVFALSRVQIGSLSPTTTAVGTSIVARSGRLSGRPAIASAACAIASRGWRRIVALRSGHCGEASRSQGGGAHHCGMRIVHIRPEGRRRNPGEIFVGHVESQDPLGEASGRFRLTEVTFKDGARNKLHTHESDQVLLVTAGEGIVATEHEEHEIATGDLALIPAGERHWHGARPGKEMTHWSILGPGKTTIV